MLDKEINNINELETPIEYSGINETVLVSETLDTDENTPIEETGGETKEENTTTKKNVNFSSLVGGTVVAVAAAVVGVTNLINVSMSAKIDQFEFVDSAINYEISVDNLGTSQLFYVLYDADGAASERVYLTDDDGDGKIIGSISIDQAAIDEKMNSGTDVTVQYRMTLSGEVGLSVIRDFDSYVLQIDKMTSTFSDVDYECHCGIDGYYYFKMNFVDNYGLYTDFEAYIIDDDGTRIDCVLSDDLHDWQKIYVLGVNTTGGTCYIKYHQSLGNGESEIITIEQKVKF